MEQTDEGETDPAQAARSSHDLRVQISTGRYVGDVVLYDGPQVYRRVKCFTPLSPHTGEIKPASVTIESFTKSDGKVSRDPKKTVTLYSEHDEVHTLLKFLLDMESESAQFPVAGYLVFRTEQADADPAALGHLVGLLSATGCADVVASAIERAASDPVALNELFTRAAQNPQLFDQAVAGIRLAAYTQAVCDLRSLVEAALPEPESSFQALLQKNPWMFGSEYSDLLDRRIWVRDQAQDFMLRRTTDRYMELIEIKTTLVGRSLFVLDRSHDCLYPNTDLTKAVAQVQQYLQFLDSDRDRIQAHDKEDPLKIRAKIVIGRNGDQAQQEALRRFNAHLLRIEVLTFDQLLCIAEQVLKYLRKVVAPTEQASPVDDPWADSFEDS